MSKDSLRGLVQLVAGLGEMTVARAGQAARDLVALTDGDGPGDQQELTRQVRTVTQEILKAAEANRAQVSALVRSEVESALARAEVARVVDVDAARATTAALFGQVEDLTNRLIRLVPGLSGSTSDAVAAAPVPVPEAQPLGPVPVRRRPARRSFSTAGAAVTRAEAAPGGRTAGGTARARKASPAATARKATARKAATTKATATKATATKATATKAATTKATATKATTTKAAPTKAAPTKATTKKATATKATVQKAPTKKATTKKAAEA